MYLVKIDYDNDKDECVFETHLPKIPNVGDQIGMWHHKEWVIVEVDKVVYELDEFNKYLLAEISVFSKM
jgi:hypothetical protein